MPRYGVAVLLAMLAFALLVSAAEARGKPPPTTVTVVYFYPRDQEPVIEYVADIDPQMTEIQGWYEQQVGSTFALLPVQVIRGKGKTDDYGTGLQVWNSVLTELGYWCGTGVHVLFVHRSIPFQGGGSCDAAYQSSGGGTAMLVENTYAGVVAHELGHAFALPHSTCESVMWCWWDYPSVGLLDVEIQALQASSYFGGSGKTSCEPKFNPHGKLVGKCR